MLIGATLTKQEIKSLCGSTVYSRGDSYFRAHRVTHLDYDPNEMCYEAVVRGTKRYNVSIAIDEHTLDVDAHCQCPAYSGYSYCKHIAAVMLQIETLGNHQKSGAQSQKPLPAPALFNPKPIPQAPSIPERDVQLAKTILTLFEKRTGFPSQHSDAAADERQDVSVEYICRIGSGYRSGISVELKVGPGKLYVVHRIKDFLDSLETGTKIEFTKLFSFDTRIHRFKEHDEEIIRLLRETHRNERSYREIITGYSSSSGNDRTLFIPPSVWESLLGKLGRAAVHFEIDGKSFEWSGVQEEEVPLRFRLGPGPVKKAYTLDLGAIAGLKLMPKYGLAIASDGKLYRTRAEATSRLVELQSKLSLASTDSITIPPEQVDGFMRRVVPELKQYGTIDVDAAMADQIVNEPLTARVYLDRSNDRLHAKVEFAYGEFRLSPIHSSAPSGHTEDHIVMRQPDQEDRVLDLLRQADFRQTGEQFVLDAEEAAYDFLFGGLERLQQAAEVYVTPGVQGLRPQNAPRPRATVDTASGTNWLEVRFDADGIDESELVEVLRSLAEKKRYHRLKNGAFVPLEEGGFRDIGRLFDELGIRKQELKEARVNLPVTRGLSLQEYEAGGASGVKLGRSLRQMLSNLKNPDQLDFEPPSSLVPILRDYQTYGYHWMRTIGHYGFGGILADDMGLGKTLQSIAYIASVRERSGGGEAPVLIVCPASLIYNWRNELAKFAPQLKAAVVAGTKAERDAIMAETSAVEVLITSYPLLRRDLEWYEGQKFHTLFLDEAQAIKNNATQTAQAVKSIAAGNRFALTGTPVENRLEELWSIFDAVFPELFQGRKSFSDMTPEQVARKIRPFLLRRLKKDVLTELPDKIETVQTSELLPEQKKLYLAYLRKLKQETEQQLQAEGFQKSRLKILAGLTRLRQLCCHPALFLDSYKGESGKLEQLLEMIGEYRESGRRMLVFSQFTGMLALIREEAERRRWPYFYLDGSTKANERVELCRRFNDGEAGLFLISLKAGGTGLNLTGADTVILYDLWWNPAVEQQAADRAHRIGQKNVVQVIRLMTEGTIEEKMYELQQRKKDLIDSVIQPGEEALSALTEDDIRELLSL